MSVYIYIFRSMKGLQEGVPRHVREWINHWADICEPQGHNTKKSDFHILETCFYLMFLYLDPTWLPSSC